MSTLQWRPLEHAIKSRIQVESEVPIPEDESVFSNVAFGVEELAGDYKVINGQIVWGNPSSRSEEINEEGRNIKQIQEEPRGEEEVVKKKKLSFKEKREALKKTRGEGNSESLYRVGTEEGKDEMDTQQHKEVAKTEELVKKKKLSFKEKKALLKKMMREGEESKAVSAGVVQYGNEEGCESAKENDGAEILYKKKTEKEKNDVLKTKGEKDMDGEVDVEDAGSKKKKKLSFKEKQELMKKMNKMGEEKVVVIDKTSNDENTLAMEAVPAKTKLSLKKKKQLKSQAGMREAGESAAKKQKLNEIKQLNAKKFSDTEPESDHVEIPSMPEWEAMAGGDAIHPFLLAGLSELGFHNPTPIQGMCIPAVLMRGRDVLGCAQTGSGKTLAYGLPMLSSLMTNPPNKEEGLPALVLTPTRELAMQVTEHLRKALCKVPLKLRPRIESVVGGMSEEKQNRVLDRLPEIVVATVGRLQSLLESHEHLSRLRDSLRFLIIDEADRMADPRHYGDIAPLVANLNAAQEVGGKKRQTLLFSATLLRNNIEEEDKKFASKFKGKKKRANANPTAGFGPEELMKKLGKRGKPEICDVTTLQRAEAKEAELKRKREEAALNGENDIAEGETEDEEDEEDRPDITLPDTISFFRIDCSEEDKESFLHYVLSKSSAPGATLVFVNTIAATRRLSATIALSFPAFAVSSLHANMDQKQRLRHLDRFKGIGPTKSQHRILVASDVAARGLDISGVDTVIHYGIPKRIDTFVHRSGRCGRAGRDGTVIMLCSGPEAKLLGKIRSAIRPKEVGSYPVSQTELKHVETRVRVCKKLEKLETSRKIESSDRVWMKRNAREADIELDSDSGLDDDEDGTIGHVLHKKKKKNEEEQVSSEIGRLRRELKALLFNAKGDKRVLPGGSFRRGRKRVKTY